MSGGVDEIGAGEAEGVGLAQQIQSGRLAIPAAQGDSRGDLLSPAAGGEKDGGALLRIEPAAKVLRLQIDHGARLAQGVLRERFRDRAIAEDRAPHDQDRRGRREKNQQGGGAALPLVRLGLRAALNGAAQGDEEKHRGDGDEGQSLVAGQQRESVRLEQPRQQPVGNDDPGEAADRIKDAGPEREIPLPHGSHRPIPVARRREKHSGTTRWKMSI